MPNILICDDEKDIVNALKIYLSDPDYTLFEAYNGKEALSALKDHEIHLILLDMVALLDWFWAHPLSLSRFETPDDGTFVFSSRTEQPDAFREQIPDFSALGYTAEVEHVNVGPGLYDGNLIPVWFEGIYKRGETQIRWSISIGADADAWSACLGRPNEVTEEMLNEVISQNQCLNLFFDVPCMATLTIEQGTSADAWEIIQTLQR